MFTKDVTTPEGLQALNEFLSTRSYIDGFKPSTHDVTLVGKIAIHNVCSYPHVARWAYHILGLPCHQLCQLAHHDKKHGHGHGHAHKSPAAKAVSPKQSPKKSPNKSPAKPAAKKKADDDDFTMTLDDDSDDGRDDDMEELLAKKKADAEAAKKAGVKSGPIAKSTLVMDVKPVESDTDLDALNKRIRDEIQMDGLVWGKAEKVPIAYGICKLRIAAVVEDEKVSVDELQERIEAYEDSVQSTDVISFNKL